MRASVLGVTALYASLQTSSSFATPMPLSLAQTEIKDLADLLKKSPGGVACSDDLKAGDSVTVHSEAGGDVSF